MTSSVLRAGDPAELLSLIPFLLGFQPANSLVVLAVAGERVVFTARLDLRGEAVLDTSRVGAVALQHGADHVLVVAYADDRARADDVTDLFVQLLPPELPVAQCYAVSEGRYWCLAPGCGCAEGVEFDPTTTSAAASAVLAGLRVQRSRDDLAALVRAPSASERAALEQAYERVGPGVVALTREQGRSRLGRAIDGFVAAPRPLGVDECVELAMLVREPGIRDTATTRVRRADAERHVDLWSQVARASLDPFAVAPVCLAGLAGWVSGDGALLNVCIERAETSEPEFSLLCILRDISDLAVPPQQWDALCAEMKAVA